MASTGAKRTTFRPAAARASGAHEFYEVVRQMIGSLRDAHTRVYSPEEKFDWWNPRFVTTGLTIREIDGLPIVVGIDPGSAVAGQDIHLGDSIVSVDTVPVSEFIAQRLKNSNSAEGLTRSRVIATLLEGTAASKVEVLANSNRQTQSTTLARYWSQRQLGFTNERKGKGGAKTRRFYSKCRVGLFEDDSDHTRRRRNCARSPRHGGGDAEAMADVASLF